MLRPGNPPPALPADRCGHSRPGDSVWSSTAAANNGFIDADAQRLSARVPPPFSPRPLGPQVALFPEEIARTPHT